MTGAAVLGLASLPAAANGFGRFGYALVLPSMRSSLDWSALTAGSLNAANALGYLAGAIVTDRIAARLGERRALLGAALVCSLAVLACAASGNVAVLLGLRVLAGVAAAVTYITGGALVARLAVGASARTTGRMLGVYFSGPAAGIAVSAVVITPLASDRTWRECWLVLGGLCLACVLLAGVVLRGVDTVAPADPGLRRRPWQRRPIVAVLVAYGLFGAGYIAYMTFAIAYLAHEGRSTAELTVFWFVLGVFGMVVAATLFPPLQHLRDGRGVALLTGIVALGSVLPLVSARFAVAIASAVLFSCFLSMGAAAAACARHALPPAQWAPAIAGLTTAFGLGQCVGPILAGALSDGPGGLRVGMLVGTVLLAAGAMTALAQPAARTPDAERT